MATSTHLFMMCCQGQMQLETRASQSRYSANRNWIYSTEIFLVHFFLANNKTLFYIILWGIRNCCSRV